MFNELPGEQQKFALQFYKKEMQFGEFRDFCKVVGLLRKM
jgi:hypothetical protein